MGALGPHSSLPAQPSLLEQESLFIFVSCICTSISCLAAPGWAKLRDWTTVQAFLREVAEEKASKYLISDWLKMLITSLWGETCSSQSAGTEFLVHFHLYGRGTWGLLEGGRCGFLKMKPIPLSFVLVY